MPAVAARTPHTREFAGVCAASVGARCSHGVARDGVGSRSRREIDKEAKKQRHPGRTGTCARGRRERGIAQSEGSNPNDSQRLESNKEKESARVSLCLRIRIIYTGSIKTRWKPRAKFGYYVFLILLPWNFFINNRGVFSWRVQCSGNAVGGRIWHGLRTLYMWWIVRVVLFELGGCF